MKAKQDITTRIINAYHKKKTYKTVSDYIKLMRFYNDESNGYLDALIYAEKHFPKMLAIINDCAYNLVLKFYNND